MTPARSGPGLAGSAAAVCLPILAACTHVSTVLIDPARSVSPSTKVVILDGPPTRSYVALAILEVSGPAGTSLPRLIERMRQEAMDLGADALLPTSAVPAPPSLSHWLRGVRPAIRGVAIQYR